MDAKAQFTEERLVVEEAALLAWKPPAASAPHIVHAFQLREGWVAQWAAGVLLASKYLLCVRRFMYMILFNSVSDRPVT